MNDEPYKKSTRFVIEGEWSGYQPSQKKIAHRKVYSASYKKLRKWVEENQCILFTDGTLLLLSVRDCLPRERVRAVMGYTALIDDCAYYNVTSVSAKEKRKS